MPTLTDSDLDMLESQTLDILREGFSCVSPLAMLWSISSTASTLDDVIAELEKTREPERAGRTMDSESEDAFERLRATGYM